MTGVYGGGRSGGEGGGDGDGRSPGGVGGGGGGGGEPASVDREKKLLACSADGVYKERNSRGDGRTHRSPALVI